MASSDEDGDNSSSSEDERKKQRKKATTVAALFDDDSEDSGDDDDDAVGSGSVAKRNEPRIAESEEEDADEESRRSKSETEAPSKQKIFESSSSSGSEDEDDAAAPAARKRSRSRSDDDDDGDGDGDGEAEDDRRRGRRPDAPLLSMGLYRLYRPRHAEPDPPPERSAHFARFPALLGVATEEFSEDVFDGDAEERRFKFPHNIIRWGFVRDNRGGIARDPSGRPLRRSNARMVKWSDGSWTLVVGAEAESFQVDEKRAKLNYLYATQNPVAAENEDPVPGTLLECQGELHSRFTPRPMSLSSEAHRAHTIEVKRRTIKTSKIREYVTQVDPEAEKNQRIRNKEDLNRSVGGAPRNTPSRRGVNRRPAPGMNSRYLDDGNYSEDDLGAIKRNRPSAHRYSRDRYRDDDGSEEDNRWSNKYSDAKKTKSSEPKVDYESEAAEEEFVFGDDDSDDDDVGPVRTQKSKYIDDD